MKNKRANIPITILVLGVVVICALALTSFFSSSFNFKVFSTTLSVMEEFNVDIDEYNFYKSNSVSEERINELLNVQEGSLYIEKGNVKVRYNLP